MKLVLRSIEEEERDCRKAWKGSKATHAWHCHHEVLVEALSEPAENRIYYILAGKPQAEQALRLRLFRPVKSKAVAPAWKAYDEATAPARKAYNEAVATARKAYNEDLATAWKAYNEAIATAHAKECPGCPWDGRSIFG